MKTEVEIKTNPANMLYRLDLATGKLTLNSDFVFVVYTPTSRQRLNVPAGSVVRKKVNARRERALLVRDKLSFGRSRQYPDVRLSWKQVDDAFLDVLRQDGVAPWKIAFQRIDLYCEGFLRKLWKYWAVPKE